MLINIDPILSPELLSIICSMGHGDKLVLCDANYPAVSTSNKIIRMDGVNIPKAAEAILSVFPLDSFIPDLLEEWRLMVDLMKLMTYIKT